MINSSFFGRRTVVEGITSLSTNAMFVYGQEQDDDVQIAQSICKAEGLPVEWIDKSTMPLLSGRGTLPKTQGALLDRA